MSGTKLGWKDDLVAALLAAGTIAILLATVGDLGYARDEGFYFHAADAYGQWFELLFSDPTQALNPRSMSSAWRVNSEHPGLIKSLFALSHVVLQKKWHVFSMEGTSYRFPGMFLAGCGVALVYRWGAEARGRIAGLFAAFALLCLPRFFYHAHLACFDVPIVTMFLLSTYTFWKALREGGLSWFLAAGVSFGLALDTKHNSWFLPILAVTHTSLVLVREKLTGGDVKVVARRAFSALVSMATLGPIVMFALWPWLWRDPVAHFRAYAEFHLNHEYYNMEFLGQTYWTPPMPRLYAPVMTAATVPTITLALFLLGFFVRARARTRALAQALEAAEGTLGRLSGWARKTLGAGVEKAEPGGTDLLWLLAIGVCYGAWLLPKTPIFGGTKHWMTAYPFVCLFAGAGFSWLVTALRVELRRAKSLRLRKIAHLPAAQLASWLFVVALAGPALETVRSHPWGLSAYVPLVGGAKGAATIGLNRSFWGYTTGAVVGYLNREVPRNGTVYVHDTAWPAWEMLQRDGRLRKDIRGVGAVHEAEFALYHHEQHMEGQEYQAWVAYGTTRPDHIAGLDGVPVIWVYRKKK